MKTSSLIVTRSLRVVLLGAVASAGVAGLVVACSTLGENDSAEVNLPTSGVGPFRALVTTEMRGVPPLVLESSTAHYREPAALPVDPSDGTSSSVYLFAVAHQAATDAGPATDVIVRTRADDARSFYGTATNSPNKPAIVLRPDQPWEGPSLAGPSAVRAGAQIFLYYAAAGGIGLAQSTDGLTFTKQSGPVLAPDPSVAWETSVPAAPSVAVLSDGTFRMLYGAGVSIGEASSADGVTWQRLDADPTTPAIDPVLGPGTPVDPSTLVTGEKPPFDTAQVTDPCLSPRITAAGRLQYRVLYTGYVDPPGTAGRNGTIGFAARYGESGPLTRQVSPLYSVSKHEAAPALFEWGSYSMLYVQQDDDTSSSTGVLPPAVAAAIGPANVTLSAPKAFPSAP